MVDGAIEGCTKGNVGEVVGQVVYCLVEVHAKREMGERGREVFDWLVEVGSQEEVGE